MAEQREGLAILMRLAEDKISSVKDGADGKDGRDGLDGNNGRDGIDGAPGKDGENGQPGRDGTDGAPGVDGQNGVDGKDGRDGLDVSNIEAVQDGAALELSFTVGETRSIFELALPQGPAGQDGKDGDQGLPGEPGENAYPGEARGLFSEEETYRALDVVSFNGSEWRAKMDEPGPIPGDGWMLSASRGKRGDRGERGEVGKDGAQGKDGSSVVAAYVDTNKMKMVLTRDDGGEVEADLYDLATKIREA